MFLTARDRRINVFWLNRGQLKATGLDKVSDLYPAVGVKNSCQPFLFLVLFPRTTGGGKHTSNLGKDTDGMNGVDVSDDVRVCLFVFQEEGA